MRMGFPVGMGFPRDSRGIGMETHFHGNGNGNDFRVSGNSKKYMVQKFPFASRFIILFGRNRVLRALQ